MSKKQKQPLTLADLLEQQAALSEQIKAAREAAGEPEPEDGGPGEITAHEWAAALDPFPDDAVVEKIFNVLFGIFNEHDDIVAFLGVIINQFPKDLAPEFLYRLRDMAFNRTDAHEAACVAYVKRLTMPPEGRGNDGQ